MSILVSLALFSLSFVGTLYVMPHSIRRLKAKGITGQDMYKEDKPLLPTNGGMIVLFVSYISICLLPLILRIGNLLFSNNSLGSDMSEINLALLLIVSIYAIYGLIDDLVDLGHKLKLLLPISFAYPLTVLISPEEIWIPLLGNIDLTSVIFGNGITKSDIFRIVIIPVYVMVVANLVNMHSGYNGLQSGLSIILVFFLFLKSYYDNKLEDILPASSFLGAMLAFWFFNRYPAKIFEGNIGSLLFGSLIGAVIVVQEYWWFGFFILIPHSFNFLLWVVYIVMIRKKPNEYLNKEGKHHKFGFVKNSGYIQVPNRLTLKWIPNYYFQLTEQQSTFIIYFITILFCLIGLVYL